ncbi:hypothetical protein M9Y10_030017 [Tritrichomonas musculus]|uniref:Uncharacterized protein n=1 Tax=Tritrichomonas musculus TaxID=1915356 RepID=A0ABR2KS38_9EUKA
MIKESKIKKAQHPYSRYYNSEKTVAQNLIDGFEPNGSKGETLIEQMTGSKISNMSFNALMKFGELISIITGIVLPRNSKRLKGLMIKWFDDNYILIEQYKPFIYVNFGEDDFSKLNQIDEITNKKNDDNNSDANIGTQIDNGFNEGGNLGANHKKKIEYYDDINSKAGKSKFILSDVEEMEDFGLFL